MKKVFLLLLTFHFSLLICNAQKDGKARIDSLLSGLSKAKEDTTKVNLLNDLCFTYYSINTDEGIKYGKQGLELAEKLNWQKGIGEASRDIGVNYAIKGNTPEALDYFFRALKMYDVIGNKAGEAIVFSNIANIYNIQQDYPHALENYFKSLKMFEELKKKSGIANNLGNIGVIYWYQKNYSKALDFSFKALKMYEEIGDKRGIARNTGNIGLIYQDKNNYEKALEYYYKALNMERQLGNQTGIATHLGNIGAMYFTIATNKKSTELLNKLFDGNSTIALQKAKVYSDSAIVIDEKTGDINYLKQAYNTISATEENLGDYKGALMNYKKYSDAKDSIFNTDNEKKITTLQLKYEFDKKETAEKAELQRQTLVRNYIYIGCGIIVIFLIIVIIQRNKIAKERRKMALEQERNRISRELHDDLGAQLSTARMFISSLKNSKVNEDISQTIDNSLGLLDSSISDLRKIMEDMHSSVLRDKGYLLATEALVNKINQLHVIKFTLSHHDMDKRLEANLEHQLYRITQELVNNSLKYAKAKNVSLDLLTRDGNIILMYEDDGIGYDIKTIKKGNGLNNIETRVYSVGGTVEFDSTPGAGARTIIEIPVVYADDFSIMIRFN